MKLIWRCFVSLLLHTHCQHTGSLFRFLLPISPDSLWAQARTVGKLVQYLYPPVMPLWHEEYKVSSQKCAGVKVLKPCHLRVWFLDLLLIPSLDCLLCFQSTAHSVHFLQMNIWNTDQSDHSTHSHCASPLQTPANTGVNTAGHTS